MKQEMIYYSHFQFMYRILYTSFKFGTEQSLDKLKTISVSTLKNVESRVIITLASRGGME